MSANLLRLLQLSDPSLPIGSFSHSSGLETYVQKGIVKNLETAGEFITQMLSRSIQYNDAAFLSLAFDSASQSDLTGLINLDCECSAVKLASEPRLASQKLGKRLLKLFAGFHENDLLSAYHSAIRHLDADGNHAIVFGLLSATLGIEKRAALSGFYYNATSGFVTNCVKLIPLGQQAGQRLLFSLLPLMATLVEASLEPDKSKLGYSCPGFDIRCMQHEGLYSRLYMS